MIPSVVRDPSCEHVRLILASKELVGFGPLLVIVPKHGSTQLNSHDAVTRVNSMFSNLSDSSRDARMGFDGCSAGNGGELILIPTDDAYVSPHRKQLNHGSETTVIVDGRPGNVALMKFDVSCLDPNLITSAVLKVYTVDGSRNGGLFSVLTHDDGPTWHEGMVTWNNAPRGYNHVAQLTKVVTGTWIEVDITNALVGGNVGSCVTIKISSTSNDR